MSDLSDSGSPGGIYYGIAVPTSAEPSGEARGQEFLLAAAEPTTILAAIGAIGFAVLGLKRRSGVLNIGDDAAPGCALRCTGCPRGQAA
jgi:hypothetical protein